MSEIDRLVELIESVSGIVMPDRERQRLLAIAEERAGATGQQGVAEYVRYLGDSSDHGEWRELLARITVSESSLFRGAQQFRALAEQVIPRLAAHRPHRRLRLWSAGCARGEEAASLAIVLAETLGLSRWDWRILASDVNESVLDQARRTRFGRRAMARVEPELAARHFTATNGEMELAPRLRERIEFRAVNLIRDPLVPAHTPFDVVFLRNVLIYFRPPAQRLVVERVAANLAEDGALFVGPSESLWQLHTSLEPEDLGDCFCYRLRRDPAGDSAADAKTTAGSRPPTADVAPRSRAPRLPGAVSASTLPASAAVVGEELMGLLGDGQENRAVRFAVDAVRRSPDDAALRSLEGRAWELAAEPERAVSAYRAALYVEPRLADVRYLLAGCLDRLGRAVRARRERRFVLAAIAAGRALTVPELAPLGVPGLDAIGRELESQEKGDAKEGIGDKRSE